MAILDIEASGFGEESALIEIDWCLLDGSTRYSRLTDPDSAGGWDHWGEAQRA
ncbi:MAG: hypothetical protein R3296_00510 [Oleiphilaceae bacterium]|nr:hypothetical protein [Oleiphilaceae bacterium]